MTSKFSPSAKIKSNLGQGVLRGTDAFDSEQLYSLLGLLILEGRIPVQSENGRKPGPHAHYAFNNNNLKNHICDPSNACCIMAQHYRDRLTEIARRNQMVCIEVWLLPECGHYDNFLRTAYDIDSVNECVQLDCPMQDSFLLIEQWCIKMVPKRNFQGPVQTVTSLLKTVTSYLHSSILSNELIESQGRSPRNIYYRISALQNTLQKIQDNQLHLYKSLSFPAIAAGETNILNISVCAINIASKMKSISCDICLFDSEMGLDLSNEQRPNMNIVKNKAPNTRVKLSSSSSAFSVSGMSKREKSISESQDKRRGFTLPLNSTRFKQQIISPMVVCTDQYSQPPPSFLQKFSNKQSIKDSTPYPKYKTNQDMISSFAQSYKNDSIHQIDSSTPINKSHPKSENKILFTDSSSSESIDKSHNQTIFPISSEKEPYRIFSDNLENKTSISTNAKLMQPFSFSNSFFQNQSEIFNKKSGLPLQSSPAPIKKYSSNNFYSNMTSSLEIKNVKNTTMMSRLAVTPGVELEKNKTLSIDASSDRNLSSSAPVVSSQKLLVNFEESMLNMRIHPVGVINGFEIELGASGSFNPKHVRLPLTTYFFQLSEDNAPSPYLGFLDLQTLSNKRGYQVPKKGSVQLTLFNPNGAVIKMFVVLYNLSDMPPNHQTFLRQRTIYMPIQQNSTIEHSHTQNSDNCWSHWTVGGNSMNSSSDMNIQVNLPSYLRYLVHLKLHTSKTGKLYLHTDIRLIFSRDKFEFDPTVATYELRSFVDPPPEPRYSPKN